MKARCALRTKSCMTKIMTATLVAMLQLAGCGEDNLIGAQVPASASVCGESDMGLQLGMGPFTVPPGDVQVCQTFKLPNAVATQIDRIDVDYGRNGHHTAIYRSDNDYPDQIFDCKNDPSADWSLMAQLDAAGGGTFQVPGAAYRVKPYQQVMLLYHVLNASAAPSAEPTKLCARLHENPDLSLKALRVATLRNTRIAIPARSYRWQTDKSCSFASAASIVALMGLGRQQLTNFSTTTSATGASPTPYCFGPTCGDPLAASASWDHPLLKVFDPALSLPTEAPYISFTCTYNNPTDHTISAGSHGDTQERCELVTFFTTDNPTDPDPTCSDAMGGW